MIQKAKQLKGKYGKIAGSMDYFKAINEYDFVGVIMPKSNTNAYYESLVKVNNNVKKYTNEIYKDLNDNIQYLIFVDLRIRNNLAEMMSGLLNSAQITKTGNNIDKCIQLLNLNGNGCKLKSGINMNKLNSIIKNIEKYKYLPSYEKVKIIERAYKYGKKYAGGNDSAKIEFLDLISKSENKKLYYDVLSYYNYSKNKGKIIGKSGRDIFSNSYMEYYEKAIFGRKIGVRFFDGCKNRDYGNAVIKHLQALEDDIYFDLNRYICSDRKNRSCYHVTKSNFNNITYAREQLKKCGVKLNENNMDNLEKRCVAKDLTDRLNSVMREMKSEAVNINKLGFLEKLGKFIKLVNKGSKYDLKSQPEYEKELRCIYNGWIMAIDGTGNITYGYFGAALKLPLVLLIGGGGAAQVNDNMLDGAISPSEVAKGDFKSVKNINVTNSLKNLTNGHYSITWFRHCFDDPYDQQWILYGYGIYNGQKLKG